jgi:ATP-dependent helicase HepA
MTTRTGFVQVGDGTDGIGKLIDVDGGLAAVEYFESPAGPKICRVDVPVSSVREVELPRQTRVFWFDLVRQGWVAGRVDGGLVNAKAIGANEDHYHVRFPNEQDTRVPISHLYVRWSRPIGDPTEYLAARVTDTPFFFDGRSSIVRHIATQRAAYGGLTALASSAIELLEHQVAIVRRVLADPIERYLLADEVGLGKTVEAGILIRQHVIDEPDRAHVFVLVPPHLVSQWEDEIATKFFLGGDRRVQIVTDTALLERRESPTATMLVVDEAHRVALRAFSSDPCDRQSYDQLRSLAAKTPRLLLLSGTPVLHQEDGFLAMLHLLDPDTYLLNDLESFRRRVMQRQSIAEAMADLTDDASAFFVQEAIAKLETAFAADARLSALCSEVKSLVSDDVQSSNRVRALRALRTHLSETYRLHRRLLRTRRSDPRVQIYLPKRKGMIAVEQEDQARLEAFDFLEGWRLRADQSQGGGEACEELFASFVSAALSHPRVLARKIERRLVACKSENVVWAAAEGHTVSKTTWLFGGEKEFLEQRLRLICAALRQEDRAIRLANWLTASRDVKKAIVFVDDHEVANTVASTLERLLTSTRVIRHRGDRECVRDFEANDAPAVLVCDASVEEGLNLQRSGAVIVHYDLPLEPVRIEQRIGRVDRIEAHGQLRNLVFSSAQHYEQEWLACLHQSIRVFDRSIAPLQYILAQTTSRIRARLFSEGYAAIEDEATRLLEPESGLDAELRRIEAQEAIDALESHPDEESEFYDGLIAQDESVSEYGQKILDSWVKDRLQFGHEPVGPSVHCYFHDTRKPTLMPLLSSVAKFRDCIDLESPLVSSFRLPVQPFTFDRAVAETAHVGLLRVGHPFMEALESLVRSDDRGTAFAVWRYMPKSVATPSIFFRFDFLIETDLGPAWRIDKSLLNGRQALRRRADEAFPPAYRTVWLDSDLEEVQSPRLLSVLNLPYTRFVRAEGGKDTSLRLERWDRAAAMVPLGDWQDLCGRARRVAERILRQDPRFQRDCADLSARIRDSATDVANAFSSRVARLHGTARRAEEQVARLEATLSDAIAQGVAEPAIRVDSTGALILASTPLRDE